MPLSEYSLGKDQMKMILHWTANWLLSITIILKQQSGNTFSTNTQERLKILCVISVESMETEGPFPAA